MLRHFYVFAVALFVNLVGSNPLEALDACSSLRPNLNFESGQLVDSRSLNTIAQFGGLPLQKPKENLSLIYVVPGGGNATGALIIKARHQLPETVNAKTSEGFPTGDMIQLHRTGYVSPCTKRNVKDWGGSVKLEQYVDQHYYGINYPWKKDFHADSSYRIEPLILGFTRGICKNTYDPEVRANFLYSDNPTIATPAETTGRRLAIAANQIGFIQKAFADKAEFYKYKLQTTIIPYSRENIAPRNCVSFGVEVPNVAGATQLEIIDSEFGIRQSWQIQWKQSDGSKQN